MEFRRKRRASADIGLIPMIDVLLVLLFFFMVATTFRHHSDIKINLPEASGSEVEQQGKAITLMIDAKGGYALATDNNKAQRLPKQDLQALKNALADLETDTRRLPFVISADGQAPHQAVVSAMDIANQVGFNHITFAINPIEQK